MCGTNNVEDSRVVAEGNQFIKDIIDGMFDWVRVVDRDSNIIYMNKAMSEALKNAPLGQKCYSVLGRSAPCENCISRKAVFDGHSYEKEEIINGRFFSVMSSPVRNEAGEIFASVEVLRDVTHMKQLQQRILEQNKKLQNDLNIAKTLQCSLLPKELPEDKISFSFIYKPCEALGGDFLDVFKIDQTHIGIYIADVSGHGVSASMLTVFLRSSINKKLLSPAAALEELYLEFNNSNLHHDLYITVFYAIIDTENKSIMYSNAGHNVSPIIFNEDRFELLRTPGIPISNWLDSPGYVDKQAKLSNGDRIFFYTDGIIELKNPANEQFGEERLLDILLNDPAEPNIVLNRVLDKACGFADIKNIAKIADDITIALLEIK
ncbi:MAG: SpoIIE family protein phosphatase [Clostridia bacterium]|nr:SpoIIE family protein phosphatase [Clostridia bacterium]